MRCQVKDLIVARTDILCRRAQEDQRSKNLTDHCCKQSVRGWSLEIVETKFMISCSHLISETADMVLVTKRCLHHPQAVFNHA